MTKDLQDKIQASLEEHGRLEELMAIREKKDKKIISAYCAENDPADIYRTLELLNKYKGLPDHDQETVINFNNGYPNKLSVKIISDFEDVRDIYCQYLESGGNDDE